MQIELLSNNIIIVLKEILKHQNICKLLYYNNSTPLSQEDLTLPANNLILKKIFPYPFDSEVVTEDCSQVRIWYPSGKFKGGGNININNIFIDIVVSKSLFLINIDGKEKIRPYEIMKEILQIFNSDISTLGKLHFIDFFHLFVNEKFDMLRLRADFILVGR